MNWSEEIEGMSESLFSQTGVRSLRRGPSKLFMDQPLAVTEYRLLRWVNLGEALQCLRSVVIARAKPSHLHFPGYKGGDGL